MKRVLFLLILVYASSVLNVTSKLYAQKVEAGWVHKTIEKEKIEKEEKKEDAKVPKEKKKKEQKEVKDYTHSIGVAVGSSYGLAYKYFFMDNLAFKTDATSNVCRGFGDGFFENFEINANVIYQLPLKTFKTCRLDYFVGGGTTFGWVYVSEGFYLEDKGRHYCVNQYCENGSYDHTSFRDAFVWGINSVLGLEINLHIPMTIELDFRPGYGLWAGAETCDHRHKIMHKSGNYSRYKYKSCDYLYDYMIDSFFDWSVNVTVSYKF